MLINTKFDLEEFGDIDSLAKFLEKAEHMRDKLRTRVFFRGHSNITHKLVPSIGRHSSFGGATLPYFTFGQEVTLLHRFRRHVYVHLGKIITDWEALLLARHHGLPTRLLDWSMSPLAAIYFSCSGNSGKDGHLWAFARFRENPDVPSKDMDIFDAIQKKHRALKKYPTPPTSRTTITNDEIRLVPPITISPRIVVQGGIFTWHSNPTVSLDSYAGKTFMKGNLDVQRLYRWHIPASSKRKLLISLERCGVSQRTLFPDLDGLAASLWQTEVLYQGK